jgi:hypothetical protein
MVAVASRETLTASYFIGEMARRAGVKMTTIRFYDARGLLPKHDGSAPTPPPLRKLVLNGCATA